MAAFLDLQFQYGYIMMASQPGITVTSVHSTFSIQKVLPRFEITFWTVLQSVSSPWSTRFGTFWLFCAQMFLVSNLIAENLETAVIFRQKVLKHLPQTLQTDYTRWSDNYYPINCCPSSFFLSPSLRSSPHLLLIGRTE